jgi:hypothetical protein
MASPALTAVTAAIATTVVIAVETAAKVEETVAKVVVETAVTTTVSKVEHQLPPPEQKAHASPITHNHFHKEK